MKRAMILMLVTVGLFFGALFGWKFFVGMQIQKAMQAAPMPAVTVSTATVNTATWSPVINAVGSLKALQGVDVTPQVGGLVTQLNFESGDSVAAGDLLVQQYVADEQAQLQGLIADRELAERNLKRTADLLQKKLVSEFDYDSRKTDLQLAAAAEEELRLRIAKKSIRAPFAGQLGIRQIDLGQYIEPGDRLVRLEARDQVLVDFPVPQRVFGSVSIGQPIRIDVDAWPGRRFDGVISAIEPQVDTATRNFQVRAVIDNAEQQLVPGMFARIEVQLPEQRNVLTAPQSAITFSPYGDSVFVVTDSTDATGASIKSVANTFVVTGATRGDQVAILAGLEAGAVVVTSGQQKLRNGAQVIVDNSVPVSNSANPEPANN